MDVLATERAEKLELQETMIPQICTSRNAGQEVPELAQGNDIVKNS